MNSSSFGLPFTSEERSFMETYHILIKKAENHYLKAHSSYRKISELSDLVHDSAVTGFILGLRAYERRFDALDHNQQIFSWLFRKMDYQIRQEIRNYFYHGSRQARIKFSSLEEHPTIKNSLEDSRSMDEESYDRDLSESIHILSHCLNDTELRVVVLRAQDMSFQDVNKNPQASLSEKGVARLMKNIRRKYSEEDLYQRLGA